MEIADIFVINKADRPGADRLRQEVQLMLGLRMGQIFRSVPAHHGVDLRRQRTGSAAAAAAVEPGGSAEARWTPIVLTTMAERDQGTDELAAALDRHFAYLESSGTLGERRRARLRDRVLDVVERRVRARLWENRGIQQALEARLAELEAATMTPFEVAEELLERGAPLLQHDTAKTAES